MGGGMGGSQIKIMQALHSKLHNRNIKSSLLELADES